MPQLKSAVCQGLHFLFTLLKTLSSLANQKHLFDSILTDNGLPTGRQVRAGGVRMAAVGGVGRGAGCSFRQGWTRLLSLRPGQD